MLNSKLIKFFMLNSLILILTGCVTNTYTPPVYNWTQQRVELAAKLRPNQTEEEVVSIMGEPVTREFTGRGSALQWCATGSNSQFPNDRYVIGFFYDGKLVGTRNYVGNPNVAGDCSTLYKTIEWRPSDKVIEYRFR
jgi:hypothetical protein